MKREHAFILILIALLAGAFYLHRRNMMRQSPGVSYTSQTGQGQ